MHHDKLEIFLTARHSLPEKSGLVAPVHFINNHPVKFVLFQIVRWVEFGYSCSQAAERERERSSN